MAITSYKAVVGYYNSAGTPNITAAVTGQLSDGWIPIGAPILTDAYGQCTQMMAKTDATPVIATSAYTVVTAANPQPPDATWDAQGEPLWIDTTTYLQAYTKGGAYLQGTVPVSRGGTGATTTLAAAANLRVFAIPNNLSEITDRSAAWLNVRPTGPLPLGGDPVNDYDATTMRWVKNYVDAGGGGGGASMNGVMNYGVGQITLWHSRAFIPSYAVVADGQLLSRAAYPELWAHAQMHSPVTDAVWLTGVTNRAKFSTGDGSTTFRVPDLNGVQSGSVRGLFGRGSSGADEYSQPGRVLESALPNITGSFTTNSFQYEAGTAYPLVANRTGAFVQGGVLSDSALPFSTVVFNRPAYATDFNANANNPVYGRYNTAEVVPNSFVGVWIIRANGGFTAANTQWQVINGDATTPPVNTVVFGGAVRSEYKIGATVTYQASLQAYGTVGVGGNGSGASLNNNSYTWQFRNDGALTLPNSPVQLNSARPDGNLMVDAYLRPRDLVAQPLNSVGVAAAESNAMRMINYANVSEGNFVNSISGDWYAGSWTLGGVRSGSTLLDRAQLNVLNGGGASASYQFNANGVASALEWRSNSDERIKSGVTRISNPLVKMRNIKGVSWTMETNGSTGFGFIAQDVEKDFPDAVSETKFSPVTLRDGTVLDDVKSVNTSGVAAALHHEAILALMDKVEALEAELSALKSGK